MLPVSSAVEAAVNADTRYIKVKIKIYFDPLAPVVYTDDEDDILIDCHALEEAGADTDNPIGAVTPNEVSMVLLNEDKRFTANNVDSPLYGKLLKNIKVELIYMIETSLDIFEDIIMGTYYTNEWQSDTGASTATLTCYDKLSVWGQLDVPSLEIQRNVMLKDAIATALQAVGLTSDQYIIDPLLTYVMPFVQYPKDKLIKYLQSIAIGFGCLIFINRDNKLVIKYLQAVGTPVATLSDDNQIISVQAPQNTLSVYSAVALKYTILQKSSRMLLLEITDTTVQPGSNVMTDLLFTGTPCISCDSVTVLNGSHVTVDITNYDSYKMSLSITNINSVSEVVTIRVYGYIMESVSAICTKQNDTLVAAMGLETLEITSEIIQDATTAGTYADLLLSLVTKYTSKLIIEARGNPLIELGDTVEIDDAFDKIQGLYLFYRSDYAYDGSVSAIITVLKVGDE